jgi:hypothetical protein
VLSVKASLTLKKNIHFRKFELQKPIVKLWGRKERSVRVICSHQKIELSFKVEWI